jgi:hypothetical protein
LKKFLWIIPIVIAFSVFFVAFNNFFVYDDFIWLYRAKTLGHNWRQMFYPDVIYFDPIVYLMFLADSYIASLDPRWYHAVDLMIHAFNAFLVYRFANMLSGDEKASLYGSILFASSFAIADAIIWSSSRVDLVSVMFSLGTLIQFLKYLRTDNSRFLWLSYFLFVLALGAKGTPLVLPVILFWLIIQEKKQLRHAVQLIPFGAVIILYVILLKLTMNKASLPLDRLHLNIGNFELAFCTLFIPEGTLKYLNLIITASLLFVVVSALGLAATPLNTTVMLRRTGYCVLFVAILPVLAVTDFKLVTEYSNPYLLLSSPSHRIYLASVGTALLGGGFLRSIETLLNNIFPRFAAVAVVVVLAGVVTCNAFLVRERDQLWESASDWSRDCCKGLLAFRHQVGEGSQIGQINFPGSRGFSTPMFKLCLGIDDITMLKEVRIGMIEDPEILHKAEKSFLFVFGSDRHVYDKSQLFRQQLLLNRMVMLHPDRPEYTSAFQTISTQLNQDISGIIQ